MDRTRVAQWQSNRTHTSWRSDGSIPPPRTDTTLHTRVAQPEERMDRPRRDASRNGDAADFHEVGGSTPPPRAHYSRHRWLIWREKLGRPECVFLTRWVLDAKLFSIRLHHWTGSDDRRYLHDHPWGFVTFVFRGRYIEREETDEEMTYSASVAPSLKRHHALHRHSVLVPKEGAWSILLCGRQRREWGYWVNGKMVKSRRYYREIGMHPCD